jgi:hypothetical protein
VVRRLVAEKRVESCIHVSRGSESAASCGCLPLMPYGLRSGSKICGNSANLSCTKRCGDAKTVKI